MRQSKYTAEKEDHSPTMSLIKLKIALSAWADKDDETLSYTFAMSFSQCQSPQHIGAPFLPLTSNLIHLKAEVRIGILPSTDG